jgi:pimeloyl-ACP methyl ester carboxylesterase
VVINRAVASQLSLRAPRQIRVLSALQAANGLIAPGRYLATGFRTVIAAAGLATAPGLTGAAEGHATVPEGLPVAQPGAGSDSMQAPVPAALSRWVDLGGPVHYLDYGGPADGPVIVCVHGLAGSAVNWSALAPLLSGRYRVLALDLPGHGLTRTAGRGMSMPALRALLHRFIETVPGRPVLLMGNSMGGLLSLLEASAAPDAVTALVLVDPVLPLVPALPDRFVTPLLAAYAVPVLGPLLMSRRRRKSPEALVTSVLSLCCVDISRVPVGVLAQHITVARESLLSSDVERGISVSARSIITTIGGPRGGAYRRAIHSVTCPVLLLHGVRDRLVPITVARAAARANPAWRLIEVPDVGHVPQLEAAADTARAITGWLGSLK